MEHACPPCPVTENLQVLRECPTFACLDHLGRVKQGRLSDVARWLTGDSVLNEGLHCGTTATVESSVEHGPKVAHFHLATLAGSYRRSTGVETLLGQVIKAAHVTKRVSSVRLLPGFSSPCGSSYPEQVDLVA